MFRDKYKELAELDADIELLAKDKRITSIKREGTLLKIETIDLLCNGAIGDLMVGELSITINLVGFGKPVDSYSSNQPLKVKNNTYKLPYGTQHPMVANVLGKSYSSICWGTTFRQLNRAWANKDLLTYIEIVLKFLSQSVGYYDSYYPREAYRAATRYKESRRRTIKSDQVARLSIPFFKKRSRGF